MQIAEPMRLYKFKRVDDWRRISNDERGLVRSTFECSTFSSVNKFHHLKIDKLEIKAV